MSRSIKAVAIVIGSVLLLLAAALATWAQRENDRPAKMKVTVRFLSYTNDPDTGSRTALVEVSNASPFQVIRGKSTAVYASVVSGPEHWRMPFQSLGPGDAELIEMDAPTNSVSWMFQVDCEESPQGLNRVIREAGAWLFPSQVSTRAPRRTFSSQWIAP